MIRDLFSSTKYIEKGLDASWTRNQVISNNIANAETPNFKSSRVEFEDAFRRALNADENSFETKKTRPQHRDFSSTPDLDSVRATVVKNDESSMRMDGNNVDIDKENVELAKNTFYYYTLVAKLNSEFTKLRSAIREGR